MLSSAAALNSYHSPMQRRWPTRTAHFGPVLLAVAGLLAFPLNLLCLIHAQAPQGAAALRIQALDLAYNLDHDAALDLLRRAVAQAPDDPAAHRTLASVLWLKMLFRRGAITVDHYLGSFSRSSVSAEPVSGPTPVIQQTPSCMLAV